MFSNKIAQMDFSQANSVLTGAFSTCINLLKIMEIC